MAATSDHNRENLFPVPIKLSPQSSPSKPEPTTMGSEKPLVHSGSEAAFQLSSREVQEAERDTGLSNRFSVLVNEEAATSDHNSENLFPVPIKLSPQSSSSKPEPTTMGSEKPLVHSGSEAAFQLSSREVQEAERDTGLSNRFSVLVNEEAATSDHNSENLFPVPIKLSPQSSPSKPEPTTMGSEKPLVHSGSEAAFKLSSREVQKAKRDTGLSNRFSVLMDEEAGMDVSVCLPEVKGKTAKRNRARKRKRLGKEKNVVAETKPESVNADAIPNGKESQSTIARTETSSVDKASGVNTGENKANPGMATTEASKKSEKQKKKRRRKRKKKQQQVGTTTPQTTAPQTIAPQTTAPKTTDTPVKTETAPVSITKSEPEVTDMLKPPGAANKRKRRKRKRNQGGGNKDKAKETVDKENEEEGNEESPAKRMKVTPDEGHSTALNQANSASPAVTKKKKKKKRRQKKKPNANNPQNPMQINGNEVNRDNAAKDTGVIASSGTVVSGVVWNFSPFFSVTTKKKKKKKRKRKHGQTTQETDKDKERGDTTDKPDDSSHSAPKKRKLDECPMGNTTNGSSSTAPNAPRLNSVYSEESQREDIRERWNRDGTATSHEENAATVIKDPFTCCHLPAFLSDPGYLSNVKEELQGLELISKSNDLYKFQQTNDLKTASTPHIAGLRHFLYGEFREWLIKVTGIPLNETVDLGCSRYEYTDVLLCHDDELEGRRVAFILYLVPSWCHADGGTLDLFDTDEHGQPREVVHSFVPEWNSFAFFEVSPISFHQVSEVLSQDKVRLSINGWFHGPPIERPKRYLAPPIPFQTPGHVEEEEVYSWVNPQYLESGTQREVRHKFTENSALQLDNFLAADRFKELAEALRAPDLPWANVGPANMQAGQSLEVEEAPEVVKSAAKLLLSEAMFLILSQLTGLKLHTLAPPDSDPDSNDEADKVTQPNPRGSMSIRHWGHGSYTLVRDDCVEATSALDAHLFINVPEGWTQEHGGFVSYITKDKDEELLTVVPQVNCLSLVYRDSKTLKFTKHINVGVTKLGSAGTSYQTLSGVYHE